MALFGCIHSDHPASSLVEDFATLHATSRDIVTAIIYLVILQLIAHSVRIAVQMATEGYPQYITHVFSWCKNFFVSAKTVSAGFMLDRVRHGWVSTDSIWREGISIDLIVPIAATNCYEWPISPQTGSAHFCAIKMDLFWWAHCKSCIKDRNVFEISHLFLHVEQRERKDTIVSVPS